MKKEKKIAKKISKKKFDYNSLYIIAGILIFATMMIATYFFTRPPLTDFDSLYEQTLKGKESPINYLYNGYIFVKQDMFWETIILRRSFDENRTLVTSADQEFQISFYYDPKSVEYIPVNFSLDNIYRKKAIVLSFSPNLDSSAAIAGVEVGKILGDRNQMLSIPVQQAVYEPYEGSFPKISCEDAIDEITVVEFRVRNTTSIMEVNKNCIVLSATTSPALIAVADRFVFALLGIMPND